MTKMYNVTIETNGFDQQEAQDWVTELANVYADMEVTNVSISGNKISFSSGFSGMEDTEPDDIKMKVEEYLAMNEPFHANNITVQ
ncbi:MAG: hypothetical protein DA328_00155 [Nitrososphaeraceae archaeon]|nr:hypothetical protein [Nitrososphaeraceae archaeon]